MLVPIITFVLGLSLSAFFSGSETGFYRVARVRLLIDAMGGDWIAKLLLWASNNPATFVATALVGNNVANYLTSLAVVRVAGQLFPEATAAEFLMTLAITPIVFIYGELLPKKLFFEAPYRLLRRCTPGLFIAGIAFSAVSLLLWFVSTLLQWLGRAPSQTIQMALARRELGDVLDEGHAVGLLTPAQRGLAQGTFALANRPIREFMTPTSRQVRADTGMTRREVLRLAARHGESVLPVEDRKSQLAVAGYVRVIDCLLDSQATELPLLSLAEAKDTDSYLRVLLRLESEALPMLALRNKAGSLIGFVTAERLRSALLSNQ